MFISPLTRLFFAPDTTTKSTLALRFKDFKFVPNPYFSFFSQSALNPSFQAYRITEEMALKISCGCSIKRGCVRCNCALAGLPRGEDAPGYSLCSSCMSARTQMKFVLLHADRGFTLSGNP
jgi:hypothetical protein